MSNNLRFVSTAGAVLGCLAIDLALFGQLYRVALGYDGHNLGHLLLWFGIFLTAIALSIPVAILYYRNKASRWEQSQRDADRIALETLAELGSQRKKSGRNDKQP